MITAKWCVAYEGKEHTRVETIVTVTSDTYNEVSAKCLKALKAFELILECELMEYTEQK